MHGHLLGYACRFEGAEGGVGGGIVEFMYVSLLSSLFKHNLLQVMCFCLESAWAVNQWCGVLISCVVKTDEECTGLACIGYGFSTTFPMALLWQILQGAMSSDIAMARTVVAEIYSDSDPKYVIPLLPLCFVLTRRQSPFSRSAPASDDGQYRHGTRTLGRRLYKSPRRTG